MEIALALIAAFGGAGFFAFLQFLIQRKDRKSDDLAEIAEAIKKIQEHCHNDEVALCRLELSHLMEHYPQEKAAILQRAEYYFRVLKGNLYLTAIFQKYLQENEIEMPLWFSNN